MSLLLDALKRAEQEKLARADEPAKSPPRAPERSGFETESPRMAPVSAPVLELQPVEPASGAGAADAKAVQNAFAAKAAAVPPARHRLALWGGLAAIVLVVVAAGGYIWYTIQQLSPTSFTARARVRPPAALVPPAASAEPSSAAKMEQLVALANAKPGAATPPAPLAPAPLTPAPVASTATPPAVATVTPAPAPKSNAAQKTLEGLLRDSERVPQEEAFTLQRSQEKPRISKQVTAGYQALMLGDLERARREYAAAADAEPRNLDAQLGLATVEARAGRRALAAALYRRALDIDPRDPTALAGLSELATRAEPDALEAQIKADLDRGESGALHFALGNVYAGEARWSEAQAEYFQAHSADPANADILFNLAVSLDHLGQGKLALGYYDRALDAASRQAAQFDAGAAGRRAAQLRAAQHP